MKTPARGAATTADDVARRLREYAKSAWPSCEEILVRGRGQYLYVLVRGKGVAEPEPLCRLRYVGPGNQWEFGYYLEASSRYERSMLPSGKAIGTVEECFDCAARSHAIDDDDWDPEEFQRFLKARTSGTTR
jgi:hypothetical protein